MLYYVLIFVIFLLVAQFAVALLPFLLPLFLIMFVISLFRKPNIRVYTTTFTFPENSFATDQPVSRRETRQIETRAPLENSIDAEYTEHIETNEETL